MALERKRQQAQDFAEASSSTARPRQSASARPPVYAAHRSESPPASAYFSHFSGDHHYEPQPTRPDTNAHFAYSTTLRRHTVEGPLGIPPPSAGGISSLGELKSVVETEGAKGLWDRTLGPVVAAFTQRDQYERLPTHREREDTSQKESASARFAHRSIQDTLAHFGTSATEGLSSRRVQELLANHGYNEFTVSTPEPVLLKFAKTIYENPLILLLCGSAIVSAVMGNIDDAVSITVAVLIVLTVGFVQEQRSEKSLEALNKLVPHHCHLIRDGKPLHMLANELVPGDIVTFTTGDRVPADVRLISAVDLEIDESSLTGETTTRRKDVETCTPANAGNGHANGYPNGYANGFGAAHPAAPGEPVALAERSCIAYMGTLVRNGRGAGVVIATGTQTEFGMIFSMMQEVEEKRTPLQLSMDELATKLSMISFGIIGVICIIGVIQQRSWLDMFTIGVSLAVAAIPEGLPIVTTVTLALGVLRMSKRKAIVKKLHSVEALGSVSVICSDKTGTLTKNEQTVTEVYTVDESVSLDPSAATPPNVQMTPALRKALSIGSLCNNAVRNEEGQFVGQSTDVALLNVLSLFDMADQRQDFTRNSELPFSSERKYMAVSGFHSSSSPTGLTTTGAREMYYIKGSIDAILDRCKFYYVTDESTPALDANTRNVILSKAQATASRGLRVIALAYGYGSVEKSPTPSAPASRAGTPSSGLGDKEKTNLVFAGFQAMLDPPRKGVADAISLLQSGGVQVVMITGDAEETALSIARSLGLRVGTGHGHSGCLTGQAIDRMSKQQLREAVGGVSVFARTTPKHKMAIVDAFQSRGAVVAMTGDGVNDAPALKMADIGVSMGKSGTDVAKEAADMILVDDNFSTILPAVEEGKSIFHNIQNFLSFQLSTACAALTLITLSTFFGLSNPLNAMQILFINILMDGPPSQSLGVDPVDPQVMRRPPRRKDAPIISKRLVYRVLFSASIIVVGTLFVYMYALADDRMSRREQTMTFTCFVFLDLVSAVQNRGLGCGLFQNKMLVTTVSTSFVVQLALIYVSFLQSIFQTEALGMSDLCTLLALGAVSAVLHEARRRYERSLNATMTFSNSVEELA
ncbi:calcium-transporting ATPase [Cerioporus squamosus]|nr:calcium-transporting ATPase [Cerioporus squamosus]